MSGSHEHGALPDDVLCRLLEEPDDLLGVATADGGLAHLNPAGLELIGAGSLEAIRGMRIFDLFPPEGRSQVESKVLADLGRTGRSRGRGSIRHLATGARVPVRYTFCQLVDDGSDDFPGLAVAMRDLSGVQRTLDRLEASEAGFHSVIESCPMGVHIYQLDAEDRLVYVTANPAASRILGVDARRFAGMTIEEAFPPLAETEIPSRYRSAAEHGTPWSTEQVDYAHGDISGAYQVHAFQIAPRRMCVMFLDITDRKIAEEDKRRLEEQLLHAQKMEAVGRLAGGIAHDFNNILTGIIGNVSIAMEDAAGVPGMTETLQAIDEAADRAATLTRQMLAFSRRQLIAPVPLDVNARIESLHKILQRMLGEEIVIDLDLGSDIGTVSFDPTQLDQVVMNLAVNARDAMPRGGTITIATRNLVLEPGNGSSGPAALQPGPWVVLAFSDSGEGMAPETKARLFEPFFTTKEPGVGTGLGLATVFGILSQHGSHIHVESSLGVGTTFSIYLPAIPTPPAVIAAPPEVPTDGRGETILVVEDEEFVRSVACKALRRAGYRVLEAGDGSTALAVSRAHRQTIDLVVVDVVMPGTNGREVAEVLVRERPCLRVLYVSGYNEEIVAKHGILDTGIHFLHKPYSLAELKVRVATLLADPSPQPG